MRHGSLRLRLWAAAAISILVALTLGGLGLTYLFERHVERRVEAELGVQLNQLIAATTFTAGTLDVALAASDPRYASPLSGFYWQVEDLGSAALVRSRSLWDATLTLPPARPDGVRRMEEIAGPGGETLMVLERTISDAGGGSFRAAVAEDYATVSDSVAQYVSELVPALVLLAVVLTAANFAQISVGLAPLEALRAAVAEVIARRRARLEVAAPTEVQPLADEIDRLLTVQGKALERARTRATDLAHGLKTPLQVLSVDIKTLRDKGELDLADDIEKSLSAIRRHIDRELARARLAPGFAPSAESRVREVAARIVDVVRRTPDGAVLRFELDVPEGMTVPIEDGDLSEIFGNLIENAARFARTIVRISATSDPADAQISVADDGPGIPDPDRTAALARGVSLDSTGGTGLGLAIVADMVEAYGGRLELSDGQPGLRVAIYLPRPQV